MERQTDLRYEVLAQVGAILANGGGQSAIIWQKVCTLQWRGHQELF